MCHLLARPRSPLAFVVLTTCWISADALAETQVLSHHVPAATALVQPTGRLPDTQRLNLAIGLPLRDPAGLSNFLAQVYDPASALYHQYVTSEQFTSRFGPTAEQYQKVIEFARGHGLEIRKLHPNRMLVDVNASVTDIEKAFHLNLRLYPHPTEARQFYAPDAEPTLDASVPVLHISGLDNFLIPHPASLHRLPAKGGATPTPAGGSGAGGTYQGKDFRGAYARAVTLTGTGQMVGLFELDGFYQSDITTYEVNSGLPNVPIEIVMTDGADGTAGPNNVEVALDIEMVISMAYGVQQVIVYEGTLGGPANDVLNRMATDNLVKQMSASWTYDTDATTTQIFMQFAAQGQTFFNASGDDGSYLGAPWHVPPQDPYLTLVGGTTLSTTGPGGAWVSETAWHSGTNASGGGVSTNISIPNWQLGINMSTNRGSTSFRNYPDVAMVADGVWVDYHDPAGVATGGVFGGTSCSAPLWAGFMALVNQQGASQGQPPVGFLNPIVYAIGTGAGYKTNFHDITTGNNFNAGSPSLYSAVAGYDLVTGWGSPLGQALINTLTPRVKAPLITNSSVALAAEGCIPANGAVDPAETVTINVSLKNLGAVKTTNLVATLQADAGVISPSAPQSYGSLSGGGSAVTRPFTFTANASCGDTLSATLLFQDGTANLGTLVLDFPIGKPVTVLTQNFDSVTAPALPSGWTTTTISNGVDWITSSTAKDSGTLSAFATEVATNGVADLLSPPIAITTPTAQLTFRNNYNLELDPSVTNVGVALDGGLLEIQIGTNAFEDILAAGGSFAAGGYNQTVQPTDDNPFAGRPVWGGNSGGFITTIVNLPASAAGQTIQLKWRFGTDTGNYYDGGNWNYGPGWYIDTISINDGSTCCNSIADLAVNQAASPDPALLDRDTTYTLTVTNLGPEPAYNVVVTDQLPPTASFSSASPGCEYTNGSVSCALGTLPANAGTNVWIIVNPATLDTLTNVVTIVSVTPDPNSTNNFATVATSVSQVSPPFVSVQPTNLLVSAGGNAEFQIAAQGAPTLSYQWYFNGTNIVGAISATLSLTNVALQHAGGYSVVITNAYGSVTSAIAQLTVVLPPSLLLDPANVTVTNVAVTLNSAVGLTYTLEYKNTLQDNSWTPVLPSVPGTGNIIYLQDTNGSLLPSRFYRVQVN